MSEYGGYEDVVGVHYQGVTHGLVRWDTMSVDVHTLWVMKVERIRALNALAPWGRDTAGAAFQAAYMNGGGPEKMIEYGDGIVKTVIEAGPKVRNNIGTTQATDDHERAAMDRLIEEV
ncbi:hypothetical protein [Streptosporangium pseudovulgare]|uniref:Uncharacterized protein n=1 Tax=Streptosporangium pseudovulgare TaxID=35765 RepID=A0ABQ2QVT3_9ACTN|nr:hypothetical protein [Streptosporangium pseudovulgare]GGP98288.1 hypothetical protein GCM10010140_30620 [Streptosporangium pseudovulgare]